jgi:hypothetical protein
MCSVVRVEADGLVEVGKRPIVLSLLEIHNTAIVAGIAVGRAAPERFVQVGDRSVELVPQQAGLAAIGKSLRDLVVGITRLPNDAGARRNTDCGCVARAIFRIRRRRRSGQQQSDHECATRGATSQHR